MDKKIIEPVKGLCGEIALPGDKSISHRAVMVGAISKGRTEVRNVLDCDDCNYTITAFRDMGIDIRKEYDLTVIEGRGLKGLQKPKAGINVGASGTSMRLLAGMLTGQDFESALKGDGSLSKRPMERIVEPLSLMGGNIRASAGGFPPLVIRPGKITPITYDMPVPSAQVKSAILLAGLYADGVTKVSEKFKSRDHTERMLKHFGADLAVKDCEVSIKGLKADLAGRSFEVPADISSASFFLVGAVISQDSRVTLKGVGINPTRAGILEILARMGAKVMVSGKKSSFEPFGDITAQSSATKGIIIEEKMIPAIIDELPIIFVLASVSQGKTVIKGAGELRVKETDRISSMRENLLRMGGRIDIKEDDIIIEGVKELRGASLKSFNDHRTCMSMSIAALAAKGASTIDDVACVSKSFPEFFDILERRLIC